MMDKDIIKQVGLSDNEAEIYLLLLGLGEALASEIAEKSKISRPHIYDTIAKLIDKGLASYVIKNNRKYFKPANPEVLLDLLKSKEMSLQEALADLKKLYAPSKEKPVVEVYEGKEGLKTILKDVLREGKEIHAFGPTAKWQEEVPIALQQYMKERKRIGFKGKMITPEGSSVLDTPLNEYKTIPKEHSSPATTFMYGDKTCIIMWVETPIGIIIKNNELADSMRSYFNLMWNEKTKTWYGKEGLKAYFEDMLKENPKEYLIIGEAGRAADIMPEWWNDWDKRRIAQGLKTRRIYDDTLEARKAALRHPHRELREIKFVPLQTKTPLITCVYGNKLMFTSWRIKNPILIMVENKEIAEDYRSQFETLWNQKQHTYYGIKGIQNVLMQIIQPDEKGNPKEILCYGTSGASPKLFPKFIENWHKIRIKNKVKIKIIYTDTKESHNRVAKLKNDPNYQIKFMPGGYESPVATFVLPNKVILMAITKNAFATVVENKDITEIYRKQFETLWKISKER